MIIYYVGPSWLNFLTNFKFRNKKIFKIVLLHNNVFKIFILQNPIFIKFIVIICKSHKHRYYRNIKLNYIKLVMNFGI